MTGADLRYEYLAMLRATPYRAIQALLVAGVGAQAIATVTPAAATIRVTGELFEPEAEGSRAYVLPVRIDNPLNPESADPVEAVTEGGIVDLLAFHPRHPARWALRTGSAEWLGAIAPQYLGPEPVHVWRSPLAWLQSGCRGIVVLSRERVVACRILAGCLGGIIAEDSQQGAELRRMLEHPWPAPQIIIREAQRVA